MGDERGVDLVVWDVAESSVVGETSLVAKIEADASIRVQHSPYRPLEVPIEMRNFRKRL